MGNKTRRNGQKRRTTRRSGGAIDKLPGVTNATELDDFNRDWDVIYIRAHGLILPDPLDVPADTFILNSIPSTMTCLFPVRDPAFDSFYAGDYNDDFIDFIRDPKATFRHIYTRRHLPTSKERKEVSEITSIYEPDDIIYDTLLQFKSHVVPKAEYSTKGATHFIVPGIFKLPIPQQTKTERNKLIRRVNLQRNILSNAAVQALLNNADSTYVGEAGNLLNPIIKREKVKEYTLSNLLTFPELQPAPGKKLFIIIHACRSANMPNDKKRMVRRNSVNRILASEAARAAAAAPPPPVAPAAVAVGPAATPPARSAQDPLARSLPGLVGMFASKTKKPGSS